VGGSHFYQLPASKNKNHVAEELDGEMSVGEKLKKTQENINFSRRDLFHLQVNCTLKTKWVFPLFTKRLMSAII
jgi:hypothetical protein